MRIKLFANARSLSQSVPLYTAIMKYLNVAEKNDAAKNIALQLSRGTSRRREGLSQYNKIYEFEAEVMGQKCQMIMTSVSGHLLALDFVSSHKNWRTCSPLSLFEAPVKKFCPENYIKIKKTLEREVRGCQALIIWTDCDREGENIGFEIISVCQEVKRDLPVYRAKFSEITQISVQRALRNLEQPNKNISDAVEVRQELDLRIGAAFTRFQTLRLQKVFPSHLADKLVSYGSCQFPTLGFVVERYRAIENFVAEAFWKISVNHTQNNLSVNFTWERGRLFDQDACQVLYNIVMENPLAKVVKIKTQPKSKWRPLPLDTVELEKLASRKLKINAKETMRLAEKLYTQGYISYPRTETNQYPKELDLGSLVQLQAGHADWGAFAGRVLAAGPAPRRGTKTDNAHPPIHPTKFADNTTLSGNEYRLYEFIVRSFLACCSKDAEGQETIVTVEISKEIFTANGLMITALNYLEVYPYEKWSSKEIHLYQMGDTFNPSSIDMTEGATSPPNLLTEADLIALMEKHGIGTDATHAEHIETIKKREYVSLARGGFVPGVLGMGLVGGYDAMGLALARPQLRARLEAALAAVCAARRPAAAVLADQLEIYKETFITVMEQANKIDESLSLLLREQPIEYIPSVESLPVNTPSALKCPKCGADMAIRPKKNCEEFYIGCQSFPSCRNAVWFSAVVKTVQVLPETCPMCGPNYHKMKFEWRNNSLSHMYPPPYVGCIGGCDTAFLEHLSINLSSVRKVPATTSNSTQSTVNSTNRPNNSTTSRDSTFDSTRNNRSTWPIDNSYPAPTQNASSSNVFRVQNSMPSGSRQPTSNRMNGNGVQSSPNSEDNAIMCLCNKQAILLTVRKQNENCGRQFYKCQVGKDNGGCDFFSWATQAGDAQPQSNSNTTTSATASNNSWGSNSTNNNNSMNSGQGWNTPRQDTPNDGGAVCNCGLPCKQLTVRKEGPNQGRAFYSCSKDFNSRCNFFEWADVPSGTSNNWGGAEGSGRGGGSWRSRGGSRGGARGGSRAGAPRGGSRGGAPGEPRGGSRGGPRLCGLCRQEGHTRNRCPQRQDD